MRWRDWQETIENCSTIIYYGYSDLYPLSEWLHPGLLPIGTGLKDDIRQDLPNLDWIVRHLSWLGIRTIHVISEQNFRGLNHFYEENLVDLNIYFHQMTLKNFIEKQAKNFDGDVIFLSGFIISNADLRQAMILHRQKKNIISILTIRGLKFRIGLAEVKDGGKITKFKEKPTTKRLLVNSEIVIANMDSLKSLNLIEEIYKKFGNKNQLDDIFMNELLNYLISKKIVASIELTGVSGEPWFINLANLETWVKLDADYLIERFSHLYID